MSRDKFLLVGWDAADWSTIQPLLEKGEMPHLARLMKAGCHGPLATLQPVLSPMLWASISTGHLADRHGITGFTCYDAALKRVRPFGSRDRTARALWNIASHAGLKSHVVNWFASHPPEPVNGVALSDLASAAVRTRQLKTLPKSCIFPESYLAQLKEWIVHPEELDAELFQLFIPDFAEIDQEKTDRLESLAKILAESLTVHNATTWIAENEEWDFLATYYPLIDHAGHAFMAFHPPQQDFVGDFEFRMFKDVVNSVYRFSDLMLGRLMALAGPEANIVLVSDHGFYNDHRRPRPNNRARAVLDADHSPFGIFVAAGPAFQRGSAPIGANLLDIAPTVLSALDLPAGRDMAGRVLLEVMTREQPLRPIPSWDQVEGDFFELTPSTTLRPEESRALVDNFVQMGYIDRAAVAGPQDQRARIIEDTNAYNLARVYAQSKRHDEALLILAELVERYPLRLDIAMSAIESYLALNLLDEGEVLLASLTAVYHGSPKVLFCLGLIHQRRKRFAAALEYFEQLQEISPKMPQLLVHAGRCCVDMHELDRAQSFFEASRQQAPDDPNPVIGLAEVAFARKDYVAAQDFAFAALQIQSADVNAHLMLARALAHDRQFEDSVRAFRQVVAMAPSAFVAHRYLARILRHHLNDPTAALEHELILENAQFWRQQERHKVADMRSRVRAVQNAAESEADEPTGPPEEGERPQRKAKRGPRQSAARPRVIVSGLPRSGTSLLMQMLNAAEVPIFTDGIRQPDTDNPKGYFEHIGITRLARNPELLDEMDGKAAKVIAELLPLLRFQAPFKIIFIQRDASEIARSQKRMIRRLKSSSNTGHSQKIDPARYVQSLEKLDAWALGFLVRNSNTDTLKLKYAEVIQAPEDAACAIAAFLGLPDGSVPAMETCVDPKLYRSRAE